MIYFQGSARQKFLSCRPSFLNGMQFNREYRFRKTKITRLEEAGYMQRA
ncbi:10469_t:CDS:2, partial [Funneliformis geosporum]